MKLVLIAFLLAVGAVTASAQGTGGHMGGGSWSSPSGGGGGGGGDGGGGGGASWSSSGGWSRSSDRDDRTDEEKQRDAEFWHEQLFRVPGTKDYTPSNWSPDLGWLLPTSFVLLALIIIGLVVRSWRESHDSYITVSEAVEFAGYRPARDSYPGGVDVSVLRIAIDGRARKFIQTELAQIAETCDTATPQGRAVMLTQVTLLLRRVRDAWVYGGALNEPMGPIEKARRIYDRHVDEARTVFQEETITNVQGIKLPRGWTDATPHTAEGDGLILVTLIIAARTELFAIAQIGDGEDLRKALEAASYLTAEQLVAVDVVWMPSEENDRMSSMELEARYPRPQVIPIRGALVGKTFCTYCAGPFPAELLSCPHCGAPAPGREKAA